MGSNGEHPKKGSLASWAYVCIRDSIRNGDRRPGDRVLESEIVESLNISRTPVREALQRLESEGLIAHDGRRGLIIPKLDHQMLLELYAMRESLEGTAARLAARHASDEEISMLNRLVKIGENLPHIASEQGAHNLKFHQFIYRCARNRYLSRILDTMHDMMTLTTSPIASGQYSRDWRAEHSKIVEAIGSRNAELAEQMARLHIRSAWEARLEMMATLGD